MPTDPDPRSAPAGAPTDAVSAAQVLLREQRLAVSTFRVPAERVVLRRRIVTEVRQVEVTVHREELEVLRVSLDPERPDNLAGGAVPARPPVAPLVIVLSEQVPVVQLHTHAYERVTVTVEQVTGGQDLHEHVLRERVEVTGPEPAPR